MLLAATRHTRRNAVSFQRFVIHLLDKLDPSSSFLFFFKFFVRQLGDGHDFLHLVNPSPPLSSFSSITKGMIIIIKKKARKKFLTKWKKKRKHVRFCVISTKDIVSPKNEQNEHCPFFLFLSSSSSFFPYLGSGVACKGILVVLPRVSSRIRRIDLENGQLKEADVTLIPRNVILIVLIFVKQLKS